MWWIFPNGKHCLPKASHRLSSQLQGHDGNACNSNSSSITNLPFTMIISFYHLPLVLTGRMNDIASDWLNHTVFLDITFIWVPSIWAVERWDPLTAHIDVCSRQTLIWAVGKNFQNSIFSPLLILMITFSKHQYEQHRSNCS